MKADEELEEILDSDLSLDETFESIRTLQQLQQELPKDIEKLEAHLKDVTSESGGASKWDREPDTETSSEKPEKKAGLSPIEEVEFPDCRAENDQSSGFSDECSCPGLTYCSCMDEILPGYPGFDLSNMESYRCHITETDEQLDEKSSKEEVQELREEVQALREDFKELERSTTELRQGLEELDQRHSDVIGTHIRRFRTVSQILREMSKKLDMEYESIF